MGKAVVISKPGEIGFIQYEDCTLKASEVRIKTLFSGISAGTQLTLYRGANPYVQKEFNREFRIFTSPEENKTPYPIVGAWAYEEVGEVCELGAEVTNVKIGDVVYGTWGHRTHNIVSEQFAKDHKLPDGLDSIVGIYSQMGAIALNAVLDAEIRVGETVAVFGQGVPGQITSQLARLNGADVIAVDLDDYRLEFSKKLGAKAAFNPSNYDAALEIKKMTNGGADKVIEISGSSSALHEAIRACVYQGIVVCSGFITSEGKGLCFGEEFHHNRIRVICSQIEAVGLSIANTWNRLRMERTIMQLCKDGRLDLRSLITHVVPFEDASRAYKLVDTSRECLQVVLKFE